MKLNVFKVMKERLNKTLLKLNKYTLIAFNAFLFSRGFSQMFATF